MKQREVTDSQNTRWVCVQAFAGVSGATADEASELAVSDAGTVTVVCTPDGGAQTKRLELAQDWESSVSDAQLLAAIAR